MMKEALARMMKSLEALAADDETAPPAPAPAVVKMTPENFLGYAADQVEKATKDKPEIRKARLAHLKETIATIAKNFEGQVPAELPITTFKDPEQKAPTTTDMGNPAPQNQSEGLGNFAANDPGPAKNGVGSTPPGGSLPGQGDAGPAGSGAPGYPESFAKALAQITKSLEALGGAPAPTPPAAPPAAPAAAPTAPSKPEGTEEVTKGFGVIWPADLNGGSRGDDRLWGPDKPKATAEKR